MKLCKRYVVRGQFIINGYVDYGEMLYVVRRDGTILTSGPSRLTRDFKRKERNWYEVLALPENAEFIGNYKEVNK